VAVSKLLLTFYYNGATVTGVRSDRFECSQSTSSASCTITRASGINLIAVLSLGMFISPQTVQFWLLSLTFALILFFWVIDAITKSLGGQGSGSSVVADNNLVQGIFDTSSLICF